MPLLDTFSNLQELGLPFVCHSTSEPNKNYRLYAHVNFGKHVVHWHETLADAVMGAACTAHPMRSTCKVPKGCNLLVLGTPCNPFSTMRSKRYNENSVMGHELVDVTFKDAFAAFQSQQPVNAVMEQTEGFGRATGRHSQGQPSL